MLTMRCDKVTATATVFEIEEIQAMEKVEQVLEDLEREIGRQHTLMSTETGEIVGIGELGRVRGILEALRTHRCWEIQNEYFNSFG